MKSSMYFLNSKSLIIDAIECIEYNKSRCVIVVNSANKVIGVLSEGDIIRLLLNKVNLNSPLKNVINKSFKYFNNDQKIDDNIVFDLFLNGVTLIPVINNERELVDIIISSDFLKKSNHLKL